MTDSRLEIDVPVYGLFTSRPAGDPTAEWESAADTPGRLVVQSGVVYKFLFHGIPDVRDADFEQLVTALAGATAVKALEPAGSQISARAFRRVAELPWLESLTFHALTDEGAPALAGLTELRHLNLEGSAVTDRGLAHLAKLPRLKDLSLHGCPVTDRGLEHLAGLTELEGISLDGCPAVTDRGVVALAAMPKLHAIGLEGCWRVTDRGLAAIAAMPRLTYLGLCRSGTFRQRLARKLGLAGSPEVGSFGAASYEKLTQAHPACNFWQPIDWDAVNRAS